VIGLSPCGSSPIIIASPLSLVKKATRSPVEVKAEAQVEEAGSQRKVRGILR
jgi:hypothetical protein